MNTKTLSFIWLFLCPFFGCDVLAQLKERPNIILFLVDDMGLMDTSVPFTGSLQELNKRYHTPNMEKLAREGVIFSQAYAAPVCTPTRVSIISGMNVAHHGVTNWTSPQKNNNTDVADQQFLPAKWNINGMSPLPGTEATVYATPYPALLRDAGYFTIHVGKAHWASAGTPGVNPYNMGFMVNIAGHSAGHPQSYLGTDNYGNPPVKTAQQQAVPDLEEYFNSKVFLTEALTREALKSLEEPVKRKQPFYLNLAHYAVHTPIMADARFVQKYLDAGLDSTEARYASLVEGMDKSLGDVMDFLHKKGIDKNTVILFMSDNGGLSTTPNRGGTAHTQNLPLKAGKGSVYEGGIHEPMLVKWPGVARPGSICKQLVIAEDFMPTILEMAGVKNYQTVQQIDGYSFVPLIKNPEAKTASRTLIWHYPNKWQREDMPGINYKSAIRQGDWKLIYDQRTGKKELYNITNDLGEKNDLTAKYPEKIRALTLTLRQYFDRWKTPMPIVKQSGEPLQIQ